MDTSLGTGVAPATRASTPGWRDARLWMGVAIVSVSVVAGVRVVGAADDSVSVWALREDLGVGSTVEPEHLLARSVRFADEGDLDRYLRSDQPLPSGRTLARGIGAGELLPVGALGPAGGAGVVLVPIEVANEAVPPSVAVGSRVDVYASDQTAADEPARLVLADAVVTAAPRVAETFGASDGRQLVVAVPEEEDATLARLIAASAAGSLTVVGRA